MPKIYELPASSTPENRSLVIEHAPRFRQPQQQQSQGSADPRQMMAGQMDQELNSVTQWFDSQVSVLDQGQLEPDKYKSEYMKLQRQAASQRVAIQAKHQAAAQQIKNMQALVEDGMLAPEQMQATMLVMAGVDRAHVKAMFAQQKQASPRVQLNNATALMKKEIAFRSNFEDHRKDIFGKGLFYIDPATGRKRKASEAERDEYNNSASRLGQLAERRAELFNILTPLEKMAESGAQAVDRYGMGREPLSTAGFGGFGSMGVAPPRRKQPTREELIKQRTKKAYEQGRKLGYWN
ncbi:hypothetical protein LCGC14_0812460 [marine sediment metagenome]|uniref:Uncharacterized protein n=1 Tax=marine sediment metagenome TaxID=412755 RepID=A0A0F9S675_9ZZZZ